MTVNQAVAGYLCLMLTVIASSLAMVGSMAIFTPHPFGADQPSTLRDKVGTYTVFYAFFLLLAFLLAQATSLVSGGHMVILPKADFTDSWLVPLLLSFTCWSVVYLILRKKGDAPPNPYRIVGGLCHYSGIILLLLGLSGLSWAVS